MLLKAITIENFKGIREPMRIELAPVTLLFGPNSAGKSTVLQALHYAHEIFERANANPGHALHSGSAIDLGGFKNLVNDHDLSKSIRLGFELDLRKTGLPEYDHWRNESFFEYPVLDMLDVANSSHANISVTICWDSQRNCDYIKYYSVGFCPDDTFAEIESNEDSSRVVLSYINPRSAPFIRDNDDTRFYDELVKCISHAHIIREPDPNASDDDEVPEMFQKFGKLYKKWKCEPLKLGIELLGMWSAIPHRNLPIAFNDKIIDKGSGVPESTFDELLSKFIVGPSEVLRDALHEMHYLGPLREIPPRNYNPEALPDVVRWSTGLGAWDTLLSEPSEFVDRVNNWFSDKDKIASGYCINRLAYKELSTESSAWKQLANGDFPDEAERCALIDLPEKRRLRLFREGNPTELQPQDLGVGISQMIPVIVLALHAKAGIAAIEQPELHIHPAWQVVLGDLFITQAKERDVSFLIETHSEHVMLRLLRRIRETSEGELPPGSPTVTKDDVAVYWVEATETGTRFQKIGIDEEGEFTERWPRGFFTERADELF